MNRILRFGWWLFIAVAMGSCGVPKTHYYTIELPQGAKGQGSPVERRILVQRLSAEQVLVDDRVLYRENPNEVGFYEHKRWAAPPVDIVTNYIIHILKESGDYANVSSYKGGGAPDLVLRGRLHRFEEVDRDKEVFTSVAMELELTDARTHTPVWRGEADCTRPVATRDMSGVVGGISGCLDETVSKLLGSMRQQVGKTN